MLAKERARLLRLPQIDPFVVRLVQGLLIYMPLYLRNKTVVLGPKL